MELIAVLLAISGLFLWNRADSRNDIRALDSKIDNFQKSMYDEMKDFHGRLTALEEKYLKSKK